MDLNLQSPPSEGADADAAFRKPSNDAVNRKYRRRSPISGSSSSDGSPGERSFSPIISREDPGKVFDDRRKKDDGRDLDRDYSRSQYGRNVDSYRRFDRQSSRSSHNYSRQDDHIRREKHADEDDRIFLKSSRSGRESRVGAHSDHTRRESEHNRPRDHLCSVDKYSQDKSDGSGHRSRDKDREMAFVDYKKYKDKDSSAGRAGSGRRQTNFHIEEVKSGEWDRHKGGGDSRDEKRDHRWSLGDHKSDHSPTYDDSREHQNDSTSHRDISGRRVKEASRSDAKELDGQKYTKEENKKYDDQGTHRHRERYNREPGLQFEDRSAFSSEDRQSPAKKPKLFKDASKFTTVADERQSSVSKQSQEFVGQVTSGQDYLKDSDIDAAKVAAMKAAELVNRNLIGTGYMSTDQKKKLLWGNKKNTTAEEPANRWDTSLFSDRERQEKFNKLMGVKGELKVEHIPEYQDGSGLLQAEKQKELQLDLEKQYSAGLRRRDGRTIGLGL